MNSSKYAFQAGLFILLSIGAAILLIARVAESRNAPTDAKHYVAVFPAGEDIAGLNPGAEVRLMGVKVGRVDEVQIVAPKTSLEDARVHVHFVIGDGLELRQDGARVELQTALTGGAWLNILSVGTGTTLAEGGEVNARASNLLAMVQDVRDELEVTMATVRKDMDIVSTELIETADSIEKSADGATTLIEKLEMQVGKLDVQVETFLAEGTGVMKDIRGVFGDSGEDIRTTLAKLSSLTTSLDAKLPETLDEITGFVNKAETSIDGVDKLIEELTGTATEARTMLADNRPDIDRTIESARRSVDELEGLVDDLRANPSRLIWPPDEKDLNNLDLYATARSYAKAAEDLESAAAALQKASADGNANAEQLDLLRSHLLEQFNHFDKLQADLWKRFEK